MSANFGSRPRPSPTFQGHSRCRVVYPVQNQCVPIFMTQTADRCLDFPVSDFRDAARGKFRVGRGGQLHADHAPRDPVVDPPAPRIEKHRDHLRREPDAGRVVQNCRDPNIFMAVEAMKQDGVGDTGRRAQSGKHNQQRGRRKTTAEPCDQNDHRQQNHGMDILSAEA